MLARQLIQHYPDTLAIRLMLAPHLPDRQALRLLDMPLDRNPPPLRTLHAQALAALHSRLQHPDRAHLYAAEAAWLRGYWQEAGSLLKDIRPQHLKGRIRILYDRLKELLEQLSPTNPSKTLFHH